MDEQIKEGFVIDNDEKAEWALEKIKEAKEERDRLVKLVCDKREELAEKRLEIEAKCDRETSYLLSQLSNYMNTVKVKSTKTQDTYQLLTGKLVRKKPSVEYVVNPDELLGWLQRNNMTDYIKTIEDPRWNEVKKILVPDVENGIATAESGEVVDGITVIEKPGTFDVKF